MKRISLEDKIDFCTFSGVFAFPRKRKATTGQQSPSSRLKKRSKRGGGRKKTVAAVPEITDSGSVSNDFLYLGIGLPSMLRIRFSLILIFAVHFF